MAAIDYVKRLNTEVTICSMYECGEMKYSVCISDYNDFTYGLSRYEFNSLKNADLTFFGKIVDVFGYRYRAYEIKNDLLIIFPLQFDRMVKYADKPFFPDTHSFYLGKHWDNISYIPKDEVLEYFAYCNLCEHYTDIDKIHYSEITGEYACQECIDDECSVCQECGNWVYYEDAITDDYTTLCQSCFEDSYIRCSDCDYIVHIDNACYSEDEEEYFCESCIDAHQCTTSDYIHQYNYKPEPVFFGDSKRYFGLEIEVENKHGEHDNDTLKLLDERPDLYLKTDGSISDRYGVEIVTHPLSMRYIKNNLSDIRDLMFDGGYRGDSIGGLHVHVNRESFEDNVHIAKTMMLIDRLWYDICNKIDRRKASDRDRWSPKPDFHTDIYYGQKTDDLNDKYNFHKKTHGRYYAVNLENEHTVEFRFFGSTTKLLALMASVEFIDAIIDIANEYSGYELSEYNKEAFFSDIYGKYEYLEDYMISRGVYEEYTKKLDILQSDEISEFIASCEVFD